MLRADRHGWTPRQLSIDACLPIAAPTRTARNVGTPTAFVGKHVEYGGSDGARTRDLRRDRPSVYLTIPAVVPTFATPGQAHFEAKSEHALVAGAAAPRGLAISKIFRTAPGPESALPS